MIPDDDSSSSSLEVLCTPGYSSEKILPSHLERLAVIYVRQSTAQQVLDHQESTRLQYGLVSRAQLMGWPKERVFLIDDDLGKSAASSEGRTGFQRLVSEVSLNHVGMILGIEMSRLARSSRTGTSCWRSAPFSAPLSATSMASTTRASTMTGYFWG